MPNRTPDIHSIQLLGGVEFQQAGERLTPALLNKARALLAYLAMESGTAHSRQRLADIFWPDLGGSAARNNLRQVVLNVQRVLGDKGAERPVLLSDRQSIAIDPNAPLHVDAVEFAAFSPGCPPDMRPEHCTACIERMEAVAGCYRGEFMGDFYLPDCPEFEEWQQVRREGLHQRALAVLEHLCNCHERRGDPERALPHAVRYAELEPLSDEGQRRVMRLLALNGKRGTALSQYDTYDRTLRGELGVAPEAETRELARRIQAGEFPAMAAGSDAAPPPPAAERRQVTVLYLHLALGAGDDPDEAMELLSGPRTRCRELLQRYLAHIVPTNDGGLLAYFGYPRASEHAALLALRAALAIRRERFSALKLRIGIHTGLTITGADPRMPDAVGRTSGLAIRLRELADPGEVMISERTQELVAGYFDCVSIGSLQLEGSAQPQEVFRVVAESGATHRLEAATRLTPLAGRRAERARLTRMWEKTRGGQRQALLLRGEAGIGKSRLVHTLRQRITEDAGTVRVLRCFPEFCQTPFHPLVGLLEAQFGLSAQDSAESKREKLTRYITAHYPTIAREVTPLLTHLLALQPDAQAAPPGERRERTMAAFLELLFALAERQPVLLVVEDLHWIDPTTLELLSMFLRDRRAAPVFTLLTARPEFHAPWSETEVPDLPLSPLADDEVRAMLKFAAPKVAREAIAHLVQRAEGVPLFAEELARMAPLAGTGKGGAIPATLHDLLATRLDSMGAAKSTAQLAAAIGRRFSVGLLREVSAEEPEALLSSLYRLRDAGLLSGDPDRGFQFRHALFQDAAYQSRPRAERRAAHRRIAQALREQRDPGVARPEILAQHWAAAGEPRLAAEQWLEAGRLANLHSANREAAAHFRAGLEAAALLPEDPGRVGLEFDLEVGLGSVHCAMEGFASPEAARCFSRAMESCARHEGSPDMFKALWGMWVSASSRAGYGHSLDVAQRLLQMAQQSGDPVQLRQAHFAVGNIQFWRGEFVTAREHLEQAMALYRPEHHPTDIAQFGENGYITSASYLSWTQWFLGLPDQARATSRLALSFSERTAHPFSHGYALTFATVLQRLLREPAATLEFSRETLELAHQHDFPLWQAGAALKQGWAEAMQGDTEGIAKMRQSVASVRDLMSGITLIFLETLADALTRLQRFDEALEVIDEAQDVVQKLGDHHVEAELYRLRGECLLGLTAKNAPAAESCFQQALEVSRRQRAPLLELRSATDLAKLWHGQGLSEKARKILSAACDRLTEGFDTADVRKARRLLDSLAA